MTPEAQRIAIAEFCGYIWYRAPIDRHFPEKRYRFLAIPVVWEYEGQVDIWKVRADGTEVIIKIESWLKAQGATLPDYLNDLNAMHEAEKNLDTGLAKQFAWELHKVMPGQQSWPPRSPLHTYIILHATAAQRAEALLRSIGKWVEPVTKQEKGEG